MILADTSVLAGNTAVDESGPLAVSIISLAELQVGVLLAKNPVQRARRLSRLTAITQNAEILHVDGLVADAYAALRAATSRRPTNDLWIAATAIAHDLTLLTGDELQSKLPGVATRYVPIA